MPDAVLSTLEKLLHSKEYEHIPNVPLFDEHDEYDERKEIDGPEGKIPNPNFGKLLRSYGKKELQEIADNCNRRAQETGNLVPFGPGHLLLDKYENGKLIEKVDERKQPPVWGAYSDFRVAPFGPKQKLAILATKHVRKDRADEDRDYPHRSIELWVLDKYADWVAHLKRSPKLDLGLVMHEQTGERLKVLYALDDYEERSYPSDPTEPPSSEQAPMADDPAPTTDKDDRTATVPMGGVSPVNAAEHEQFAKHINHAFPHLKAMHDRYMADMKLGADDEADEPDEQTQQTYSSGPGTAGATSASVPALGKEKTQMEKPIVALSPIVTSTPPPAPDAEKVRMDKSQRELEAARYQKERDEDRTRIAALEKRLEEKDKEARLARYERDLSNLISEGYEMDLAEEIKDCDDMPPEKFAKHVEKVKARYRRAPTGNGQRDFLQIHSGGSEAGGEGTLTKEAVGEIVSFATKNGIADFDEARTKYRSAK